MSSWFASFRVLAAGVALSMALLTPCARADSVTAEALFQSGREALDQGNYRVACDRFEESYRLDPTAGTALNLGNCREQLGQVASAWQRFQEALQKLPSGDARLAIAKARAEALQQKIPKLTLRAPAGSGSWVVLRDGVTLGRASLNLPLPIDPGSHVIEVRAPNRSPWQEEITVELGQTLELELAAGELIAAPAERSEPKRESKSGRRSVGWVFTGVGAAGIATSLVTGALVMSQGSKVDDECPDKRCTEEGLDAADSGRTLSTVSTVAFAAGAAFVGVGVYLVVSSPSEESSAALSRRPRSAATRTELAAGALLGGIGLNLRSSF